eukprot:403336342
MMAQNQLMKKLQNKRLILSLLNNSQRNKAFSTNNQGKSTSDDSEQLRDRLLKMSLVHAKSLGFNDSSIVAACRDLGYSPITAGVLKRGPMDLIDYTMELWFQQMKAELQITNMHEMNVRQRVHKGIKTRLQYVVPYLEKWPQGMYLGIAPQNWQTTALHIHKISDEIWYQAGDRAVDFSWYTKRGLLSGLYVSTELFLIGDKSKNQEATWEFLDRRLDDVVQAGASISMSRNLVNAVSIGLNSLTQIIKPQRIDDSEMRRLQKEELERLQREQQAQQNENKKDL